MSTSFTTKGLNENGGNYITYGIKEVKIKNIESKEGEGVITPSIFINFQELNSERIASIKLPFSEKSAKHSLRKIRHLAKQIVTESEIDSIDVTNVTDYATALNKLLSEKPVRIKFSAEEVDGVSKGKKNWFKAVINYFFPNYSPFAEPISVNPTKLVFNEKDDIKRLLPVSSEPVTTSSENLPF